jgi:hypothetical protein
VATPCIPLWKRRDVFVAQGARALFIDGVFLAVSLKNITLHFLNHFLLIKEYDAAT